MYSTTNNLPGSLLGSETSNLILAATLSNVWLSAGTFLQNVYLDRGVYWIGFCNAGSNTVEFAGAAQTAVIPSLDTLIFQKMIGIGAGQTSTAFGLSTDCGASFSIPASLGSRSIDYIFTSPSATTLRLRTNTPIFWLTYE